ncbi:MAG: C40 family peptidase [Alphaproteobacteria bacterium]
MPVPLWAGRYIGLPFLTHGRDRSGLDCWGLARLVMAEQLGRALPSFAYEYISTTEAGQIGELIARECVLWDSVAAGEERLGDVIVLRLLGHPMHVGVVLGDRQMLHIEQGIDSAIESYAGPRWRDRVFGFFRYREAIQHE